MKATKFIAIPVIVILLISGVFGAVGSVRSEEKITYQKIEKKLDEKTLEKAKKTLKVREVRRIIEQKHGINERTIDKVRDNLDKKQENTVTEKYGLDPGTIITILKAAADLYNTANEIISQKDVEYGCDYDATVAWASVDGVTINGYFNDVYAVQKYMPAWKNQVAQAWYHSIDLTFTDIYVEIKYIWEGDMKTVECGEVPGGPGSMIESTVDRTLPSDDPSENEDGLMFWWTADGRITADLGHGTGDVDDSGGGGCPYITIWDGERYTPENNILWKSNDKLGARDEMDVTDHYLLKDLPRKDDKYSIKLKELGNDMSYIKETKMIAIDHSEETEIAVTQKGKILEYEDIVKPDDIRTNIDSKKMKGLTSRNNHSISVKRGDKIILDYSQKIKKATSEGDNQVLLSDIRMKSYPTDVKVYTEGDWKKAGSFLPRSNGGIQAIDLTEYNIKDDVQKIKLEFNGKHRIGCIGLAETTDEEYQIHELDQTLPKCNKISGLKDEKTYTRLTPEDEGITLNYDIPPINEGRERDLMFVSKGFYTRYVPEEEFIEGVQIVSKPDGTVYTPILKSYDDVKGILWTFDDGSISTDFRPLRETDGSSYTKGTLTVIYDDWSTKVFRIN